MATTDRSTAEPTTTGPAAVARACREAGLCQFLVRPDGDGLAAGGVLASACEAIGTPYQVAAVRTDDAARRRREAADPEATTVGVGIDPPTGGPALRRDTDVPALAVGAARAVDRLDDAGPDPVAALAGAVAAGVSPGAIGDGLLERAGLERRPGIATPTDDPVDALAHSTLAHTAVAGDPEAARAVHDQLGMGEDPSDEDARRRLASWLAVRATEDAPERAATAVERALRPYDLGEEGPVPTLGGYADVLEACAWSGPGVGVALAAGRAVTDAAIDAWRTHGRAAHDALRGADLARHPGLTVARLDTADAPVTTVARLCRDFRSPEPAVIAVAPDGAVGLSIAPDGPDAGEALRSAADRLDGPIPVGPTGYADASDRTDDLIEALRGVFEP